MSHPETGSAVKTASEEGLIAFGGDLSPQRLILNYSRGIFPWYNPGEPILWWSPDPRCVIFPHRYQPSRSTLKSARKQAFTSTIDHCFGEVIRQCAAPRKGAAGTWISAEMQRAYINLHQLGFAHSVETWRQNELVGGLYGIALGKVFFGESMFSSATDASKSALTFLLSTLADWGYELVDCQITSPHLLSLGAEEISRNRFLTLLATTHAKSGVSGYWQAA